MHDHVMFKNDLIKILCSIKESISKISKELSKMDLSKKPVDKDVKCNCKNQNE